jgi:hypothetical protein
MGEVNGRARGADEKGHHWRPELSTSQCLEGEEAEAHQRPSRSGHQGLNTAGHVLTWTDYEMVDVSHSGSDIPDMKRSLVLRTRNPPCVLFAKLLS